MKRSEALLRYCAVLKRDAPVDLTGAARFELFTPKRDVRVVATMDTSIDTALVEIYHADSGERVARMRWGSTAAAWNISGGDDVAMQMLVRLRDDLERMVEGRKS